MAALAIDVSAGYATKRQAQTAADAAALAGVQDLPDNASGATAQAQTYASSNIPGATTTVTTPYNSKTDEIQVTVTKTAPSFFAGVLGVGSYQGHLDCGGDGQVAYDMLNPWLRLLRGVCHGQQLYRQSRHVWRGHPHHRGNSKQRVDQRGRRRVDLRCHHVRQRLRLHGQSERIPAAEQHLHVRTNPAGFHRDVAGGLLGGLPRLQRGRVYRSWRNAQLLHPVIDGLDLDSAELQSGEPDLRQHLLRGGERDTEQPKHLEWRHRRQHGWRRRDHGELCGRHGEARRRRQADGVRLHQQRLFRLQLQLFGSHPRHHQLPPHIRRRDGKLNRARDRRLFRRRHLQGDMFAPNGAIDMGGGSSTDSFLEGYDVTVPGGGFTGDGPSSAGSVSSFTTSLIQ